MNPFVCHMCAFVYIQMTSYYICPASVFIIDYSLLHIRSIYNNFIAIFYPEKLKSGTYVPTP